MTLSDLHMQQKTCLTLFFFVALLKIHKILKFSRSSIWEFIMHFTYAHTKIPLYMHWDVHLLLEQSAQLNTRHQEQKGLWRKCPRSYIVLLCSWLIRTHLLCSGLSQKWWLIRKGVRNVFFVFFLSLFSLSREPLRMRARNDTVGDRVEEALYIRDSVACCKK